MDVRTLVEAGTDKPVALACGKCGLVYSLNTPTRAEECCVPPTCGKCGAEVRRPWTTCTDCRRTARNEKDATYRKNATVVEWDGGIVYDPQGDRWLSDPEEVDDYEVEYAFATKPYRLRLDAESIVEGALEEHHEDAEVTPGLVEELQAYLDAWCERADVTSYEVDYGRVVEFRHALATPREPTP